MLKVTQAVVCSALIFAHVEALSISRWHNRIGQAPSGTGTAPRTKLDGLTRRGANLDTRTDSPAEVSDPAVLAQSKSSATGPLVLLTGFAMLLASTDRTIFSTALVPIRKELGLTLGDVGTLQNAFLVGYAMTNVPGGAIADRVGGVRVLLTGLALWSLSIAATPLATTAASPVAGLCAARALFGMASGVALPAASTVVSQCVPPSSRSSGLATVFTLFNFGSALGLLAGGLVPIWGWEGIFYLCGGAGMALALGGAGLVRRVNAGPASEDQDQGASGKAKAANLVWSGRFLKQLLCLIWVHGVLNWAFFILQGWLPTFMSQQLGLDLSKSAALTAAPFAVMAVCSLLAGRSADALLRRGWRALDVRRTMITLSCAVPGLSMLVLSSVTSPAPACGLLMLALGTHSFSTAGYHAHLQDVAPSASGSILGITNTVGVFVGILGNRLTGALVSQTGSFKSVFVLCAALYLSGMAVFCSLVSGRPLVEEKSGS